MKRSLFLAALATLTSGAALAQSSVTVYGRLNESVERQKVGDTSVTALVDSQSRIGFKGVEDLGGGLKASFLIEHGFNADTGSQATGAFWGRESWVALSGNFGRVRLGNMGPSAAYFAIADYISMHNHDTGSSADAFYLYPGVRTNTIAYNSPSFGGLTIDAQLGLAESTQPRKTYVLAANYVGGPLHLGASYVQGPGGPSEDDKHSEIGLRALYEMGPVTLGAYYVRNEVEDATGDSKRNAYRLSAMYAFGANELHANVGVASKWKGGGSLSGNDTGAKQFTLGYNYNLSKRTKLYAFYTKVDNDAAAAYNPGRFVTGNALGDDLSSIAFGVRHNF